MSKYFKLCRCILLESFITNSYLLNALHILYCTASCSLCITRISNTHLILFTERAIISVMFRPGTVFVGVCGEQGGTGTAFSLSTSIPPLSQILPILHIQFHSSNKLATNSVIKLNSPSHGRI